MRRTGRSPKILVLLTAIVTALTLAVPFGLPSLAKAAEVGVFVPAANGDMRIETLTPEKALYEVGDVVTLTFRMESNAAAPARELVASSNTLANAENCTWRYADGRTNPQVLPAGSGGKFNCAIFGGEALTYTVTAADAAAGVANFDLTWTEYPVDEAGVRTGDSEISTITGSLPVVQAEEPLTAYPIGTGADGYAVGTLGQIRLNQVADAKEIYAEGDVLQLTYRYETNLETMPRSTPRSVTMTSETVDTNSTDVCTENFAGDGWLAGTCIASYTITAADAAAGKATITTSWALARTGEGAVSETIVHTSEVPVTEPVVEPSEEPTEEPLTIYPIGEAAEGFATGELGQIRLNSIANAKDAYVAGDVLSLAYRYESSRDLATNVERSVAMTSETVTSSNCTTSYDGPNWFAGTCSGSYTVTEADAAAGTATITTSWTFTDGGGNTETLVHSSEVPTTTEEIPTEPREEGEWVSLATSGQWGFSCHRIPALTQAANGDILAAWDGRPGCGDSPNPNSILQSISSDGGQTWSDAVNIASGSQVAPVHGYSDPAYVTDQETGKVFLFFVKSFDQGFFGSKLGTDPEDRQVQHAAVMESSDNGKTWSEPEVITADITKDPATWQSRFASSGEGIQLRYGEAKGRLMLMYPLMLSNGTIQAYTVYSDDHGDSWQAGTPVGTSMDENKVVELSDGTLMLNTRDNARRGYRRVALSTDQGITWGPVSQDLQLPDPTNNASIIRAYPDAEQGSDEAKILLFSNANSLNGRVNGTVRVSYDDGQTWAASRVFEPGYMAYSTLTPLDEPGKYGLLYEGDGNNIRYTTISLDWVDPLGVAVTPASSTALHRGTNELTFSISNHGDAAITLKPAVTGPAHVTVDELAEVTVEAGASVDVTATVTVAAGTDPGNVNLLFEVTQGEETVSAGTPFPVVLRAGENPSEPISDSEAVNTVPAQGGAAIDQAFDDDQDTIWHSPWDGSITLPLDVDIELGDEPVATTWFQYVPRQVGHNGRINGFEIWAGNDLEALTLVEAGNWPNTSDVQAVFLGGEHRYVRVRAMSTYGDVADKFVSAAEFRVTQAVPDTEIPEEQVALELVNELPSQATFPAANMFDGNTGTYFHSPYTATQEFPYNVDLSLGDEPVALTRLVLTPQQGGTGDGANNGRPGPYRILAGDSLDDLTEIASGTWEDTAAAKTVELTGEARFVRVELGETYGNPAATFVAIAEIEVFGTEVVEAQDMILLSMERTDDNGTPVQVGHELTFDVSYTNTTGEAVTAFPRSSNLDDALPPTAPNCRYAALPAGQTHTCTTAFHVVTEADLEAGSFTPEIVFDATADRDGNQVLQAGLVATLPAIAVGSGTEPSEDPSEEPSVEPSATATVTVTPTATATATVTATATATATASATATVTASATATATATATTTATGTVDPTVTQTVTAKPTQPSQSAEPTAGPVDIYTTPGYHKVNGREWFTSCEPYSQTQRCRTDIWASQVKVVDGTAQWVHGWVFNNLTYLPIARSVWGDNPLAHNGAWTATDGRRWTTECDNATTGRNGCRSYVWAQVWQPVSPGSSQFQLVSKWVLNNMVRFS
ncbi:hypothetical protein GCM10028820_28980 [Tessaracoccus terricola]